MANCQVVLAVSYRSIAALIGILAQFVGRDPRAIGTTEQETDNTKSSSQSTDLVTHVTTLPGDISARSAHLLVRTNSEADMSLGLMRIELVDRDGRST